MRQTRWVVSATALKLYNFAVARSLENLQRAQLEPWRRPINVSGSGSQYVLTTPRPIDSQHDPSKYDLLPTDALRLGGKFFKTRSNLDGIGAPLVAVECGENIQFRQRYELPRVYAPVTAAVKFQGQQARLEFIEPFVSDHVKIDSHSLPLAADYDAPMAMLLRRERPDKLGLTRLFHPEKYADKSRHSADKANVPPRSARITRLQPFDARRTPVIFVHGLQATPVSWVPRIRALRRDPEIQRRYQLWVLVIPPGIPILIPRRCFVTSSTASRAHSPIESQSFSSVTRSPATAGRRRLSLPGWLFPGLRL